MHEPRDLKRDSLTNWQPVQLPQHWCDVVTMTGACDQTSGSVLHRLKALPFCVILVILSKLGCIDLFFVESGIKVDGRYYREVLLIAEAANATSHAPSCWQH